MKSADFVEWLDQLKTEAVAGGVSENTVDKALAQVEEPLPAVIAADRRQPEMTQTLRDYLAQRVTEKRIRSGQEVMARYPTWLGRIEHRYDVQQRFLVALWGIESNFGDHMGTCPVIQSLVTLAYDERRGSYFRRELLEALRLLDSGAVTLDQMQGSWAGAMGQCQFMPSSFRRYAVDADGDQTLDIWTSVPDVLGSIANYLAGEGWQSDQTWGRKVRLPAEFDLSLAGLATRRPLSRWQALGVRRENGRPLPRRNLQASLLVPDGPQGPAYLVYDNFRVLLSWNRSIHFAIAVGTLADNLLSKP